MSITLGEAYRELIAALVENGDKFVELNPGSVSKVVNGQHWVVTSDQFVKELGYFSDKLEACRHFINNAQRLTRESGAEIRFRASVLAQPNFEFHRTGRAKTAGNFSGIA